MSKVPPSCWCSCIIPWWTFDKSVAFFFCSRFRPKASKLPRGKCERWSTVYCLAPVHSRNSFNLFAHFPPERKIIVKRVIDRCSSHVPRGRTRCQSRIVCPLTDCTMSCIIAMLYICAYVFCLYSCVFFLFLWNISHYVVRTAFVTIRAQMSYHIIYWCWCIHLRACLHSPVDEKPHTELNGVFRSRCCPPFAFFTLYLVHRTYSILLKVCAQLKVEGSCFSPACMLRLTKHPVKYLMSPNVRIFFLGSWYIKYLDICDLLCLIFAFFTILTCVGWYSATEKR